MFKKVSNFMNKPITWGGYFKLTGICTAISVVIVAVECVVIFWDEVCEFMNNVKSKLNVFNRFGGLHFENEEES